LRERENVLRLRIKLIATALLILAWWIPGDFSIAERSVPLVFFLALYKGILVFISPGAVLEGGAFVCIWSVALRVALHFAWLASERP